MIEMDLHSLQFDIKKDLKSISGQIKYSDTYCSPLGCISLESDGSSLTGLWFTDQKWVKASPDAIPDKNRPEFISTRKWLDKYFSGVCPDFMPPIRITTTLFRADVLHFLIKVPYGSTVSYGQLSREVAGFREVPAISAQAVGNAVGHNPVSIIIPCHRVIGADGSLTGYAGGIWRKIALLELEAGAKITV